jgi:hypothetical protein
MAERRMFAKTIIDSDAFLEMPQSTQNLYFHLGMRADDDGFLNNPKKIQKMINASDDDLKLLFAKNFLIPFESGIVVIKHWRIHNYLRSDRYKPTVYREEMSQLSVKPNGAYTCNSGIPLVDRCETQVRLGEVRLGKERIDKEHFVSILDAPINDGCSRIEKARAEWNSAKAGPECRLMAPSLPIQDRESCLRTMSGYSDDEIVQAISNYAAIKTSAEHEISAPYRSFAGFMRGGVEKFVSSADPWSAYKKRKGFETADERDDRRRREIAIQLGQIGGDDEA